MRGARTRVLPAPAPASTHTGPSVASTASCCASLSPSRYVIHRLYSRYSPHALFRDFPHLALGNRDGLSTQVVVDALREETRGGGLTKSSKDSFDPLARKTGMREIEEAVTVSMSRPAFEDLNGGAIIYPLSRKPDPPLPLREPAPWRARSLVPDNYERGLGVRQIRSLPPPNAAAMTHPRARDNNHWWRHPN